MNRLFPLRVPYKKCPLHPSTCPLSYKYCLQLSPRVLLHPTCRCLSTAWRGLVHHLSLLFLESLADSLTTRHELLYTSRNTASLALNQRFGGEVIDAGIEAVRYEVGEHLLRWIVSDDGKCSGKARIANESRGKCSR